VKLKDRVAGGLVPLARTYVRFAPLAAGKRAFWARVVDPYLAWHPHRFVARTVFGTHIAGDTRDIIQQYIYYFGIWEPHLTHWIRRRLAPGDGFIDVGANIGYFSLLASKLVGRSGLVVAIEPSPTIFAVLQSNLARNRARNVRAVHAAVSDSTGALRLFRGPDSNIGRTTVLADEGFELACVVNAAPLAALLRPEEIRAARVIKIDVEGAEWSVVAGMAPLLNACRTDLEIVVEVNVERLTRQGKRPEDILAIFSDAGFHAYTVENDYSPLSYLPPYIAKRPERLRVAIERQVDLVFSRQDSELL
jgi:FkbM family methyltransferase